MWPCLNSLSPLKKERKQHSYISRSISCGGSQSVVCYDETRKKERKKKEGGRVVVVEKNHLIWPKRPALDVKLGKLQDILGANCSRRKCAYFIFFLRWGTVVSKEFGIIIIKIFFFYFSWGLERPLETKRDSWSRRIVRPWQSYLISNPLAVIDLWYSTNVNICHSRCPLSACLPLLLCMNVWLPVSPSCKRP